MKKKYTKKVDKTLFEDDIYLVTELPSGEIMYSHKNSIFYSMSPFEFIAYISRTNEIITDEFSSFRIRPDTYRGIWEIKNTLYWLSGGDKYWKTSFYKVEWEHVSDTYILAYGKLMRDAIINIKNIKLLYNFYRFDIGVDKFYEFGLGQSYIY